MYPGSKASTAAYDRAATMFSPDGRLYQVEYASKIVEQGTLGIGFIYDKGILFGADKRVSSPLIMPASVEKLFLIDDHISAISSGLVGDARRLVQIARQESQENQSYYGEQIHVETLVKKIAAIMQIFTQYGGMRPFGVSFIFGGIDPTGEKRLFETEPSGALAEYKAVAIGKNKKEAMKILEAGFKDNMSKKEAVHLMVTALKASATENEKFDLNKVDFAFIEQGTSLKRLAKEELVNFTSNKK
ncbi:MAG: proteasome subunit alpha [Candidatus Diapherotrites archaeon CG10_big_fil_rev_8_21_14_0_10_31_34]|nr:MAG: proteasome subunit alpha [Candidatus Diapherotrites archaeon CG10_big_fil_rev_8_21_14_0_10_31_34]